MDFSFGILTSSESDTYLEEIIKSIEDQKIPNYEIILIGDTKKKFNNSNIKYLQFDESIKKGWITKKKNLITENSIYENIVYLHDYIILGDSWYEGFKKNGNEFKVIVNKILNIDNQRFRDWLLWPLNNNKFDQYLNRTRRCLLPYDVDNLSKYMYISGAYWVAKKSFMSKYPLNEELTWGEGEDVEWSKRIRRKTKFKFNEYSYVKFLKEKEDVYSNIDGLTLEMLISYAHSPFEIFIDKSKIYVKKIFKNS
ncbi:hypothetical protein N9U49_00750 [Acidimicrobiaceae bacterium]|nr:hypothetical protein [Acidimicrobiaceae bacterium]